MHAPPPDRPAGSVRTVALVQTDPRLGAVGDNLAGLHAALERLSGVDLAVTPELATHGYHLGDLADGAPGLDAAGPELAALGGHGPAVVVGFCESAGGHRHNSAAIVERDSTRVQRKLYLPHYRGWTEAAVFRPGERLDCHDVRGAAVSVLVCNDLWQPQLPWLAAHSGAEILVVPANSVHSRAAVPVQRAWDLLLRHAAVVLQSYVIFVNRCGTERGARFWGGSRVVAPDGEVLVELGEGEGLATVDLDLAGLRELRREWPMLAESRFDLVEAEVARRRMPTTVTAADLTGADLAAPGSPTTV